MKAVPGTLRQRKSLVLPIGGYIYFGASRIFGRIRQCDSSVQNRHSKIENQPPVRLGLARDFFQHLSVGGEFFHEHEETLNCFLRFMPRQTAANQIDFFQLPRLQQ
jgi:hypothetical protein